jgi:RHS repeat-associated protein
VECQLDSRNARITDPINAGDSQSCSYAYDDLTRITSANCGSVWGQTFSYDAFGNIDKQVTSTGISWQPTYNSSTNHYASLPGFTPTYDANGNLTADSFHNYTWDAEGKVSTIDTTAYVFTYDALGRNVEQSRSGSYYQVVYSPLGSKVGVFEGHALQQTYWPLPGGTQAEYFSWGLADYRHPDWLGSDRLESTTSKSVVSAAAYAPFGEPYAQSGSYSETSFAGANKDTLWLDYDFLFREYDPKQGRWLSPDPAGLGAVDPTDPQTWNRYVYVRNNPLAMIDLLGEDGCYVGGQSSSITDSGSCFAAGGLWYSASGNQWYNQEGPLQTVTVTATPDPTQTAPAQTAPAPGNGPAIVEEPGNPGPNIDKQVANQNVNALAQALNKTGVRTLQNPCTIGLIVAIPAGGAATATVDSVGVVATLETWGVPATKGLAALYALSPARAAVWVGNGLQKIGNAILSDHPKPASDYHLKTGQRE